MRHPGVLGSIPKREERGKTGTLCYTYCVKVPGTSQGQGRQAAVMARRRRRRPTGGNDGGLQRRTACPLLYRYRHTHTYCSLARLPPTHPFVGAPISNGIFRSDVAPASLPPASSSLTNTRRMDGFCNQSADQLGSLAGLSVPDVHVGVVECASAFLPPASSSLTHTRSLGWMVSATRTPTSSAPSQDYLFPLYM